MRRATQADERTHRILLRAEVIDQGARSVGHTLYVGPDVAFVETDRRPDIGAEIALRLSFPRLFHAVEHAARVVAHANGAGPGEPCGIEVRFLHASAEDRARFDAALARLERSAPLSSSDPRYRVLVVEDNEFIRDMFAYGVAKYFRGHDAAVTIEMAADGGEAWDKIKGGQYDLAIVDHYLPVLDGAQLLTRVRREPSLAGLPIVGVSVGGTEVRDAMLQAGADMFINKPIMLRDLFETLERLASAQGAA
jgi:CheY-like chemotaxis protein